MAREGERDVVHSALFLEYYLKSIKHANNISNHCSFKYYANIKQIFYTKTYGIVLNQTLESNTV